MSAVLLVIAAGVAWLAARASAKQAQGERTPA
jgi:hypothetical protein